jgi:hypothetical protein
MAYQEHLKITHARKHSAYPLIKAAKPSRLNGFAF